MRFALLGPVQVRGDGGPVEIRGALRRTLLAALLLHQDSVVSADRLGELVWGEDPPASVTTSLYNQIMRLRHALGEDADRIRAVAPGYLIHVEPDELDLDAFTRLCGQARKAAGRGDWASAAQQYAKALALWRGEALADVPALHNHASIHRFQEERLVALQGRIEADLRLGRQDELVGELRTLIGYHPLREAFHGQLMLALYRSGRQAEALGVYRDLRRATVAELGVEPGPAVKDLHGRILRSDPGLEAPRPDVVPEPATHAAPTSATAPRQLPVDTRFFTGRVTELDELVHAAQAAGEGTDAGMVVISAINGMGGIGKTALAVRAAHRVSAHFPDGQLFIDLRGFDADLPPLAAEDALDYLLRSLKVPLDTIPADLDERAALYRSKLAGTRTLIVLDNAVGTAQVQPLLPGTPGCLVLITSRNRMMGLDDAHLLALDALPAADARALLHDVAGQGRIPENEPVDKLIELCGHLPLAIRILAARLRHRTALTVEALCEELREERSRLDRLNDGERELVSVFDSSLAVLAKEEQRLFRLLGLIPGPDFDAYATAHLTGTDDLRTAEGMLETLLDHNLLIQHTPGRYRLHDLLRVHASGLASQDEESPAALDRLFDYYLHAAQAAYPHLTRPPQPLPEEAASASEPTPSFADRDQAAAWMRGERANLLPVLDHQGIGSRRLAALIEAMRPFYSDDGPWSVAADLNSRAIAAAQQAGDRLAEANTLVKLGRLTRALGNLDAATAHLERALVISREIAHRSGEADALYQLGETAFAQSNYVQALKPTEQALAIFEETGDRRHVAIALFRAGSLLYVTGQNDLAADHFTQSMAIHIEVGNLQGEANCLMLYSRVRYALGNYAAVSPMIERALRLYRQAGDRLGIANALQEIGRQQLLVGGYDEAVSLLNEAMIIHRELGFRLGEGNVHWELGRIRFAMGDYAGALQLHSQALEIFQEIKSGVQSAALRELARVHDATGDPGSAAELARQALAIAVELNDLISELEARNFVAVLESEAEGPELALKSFRENANLAVEIQQPQEHAQALEGMGRCEIRLGQQDSGLEHLRQAVELYRQMGVVEYGPAAAYLAEVDGGGSGCMPHLPQSAR